MAATIERTPLGAIHPFHAVMLASTVPLFLGALLCDWAYWSWYHIQWANFASWLLAYALVFGGVALLCAVIGLVRGRPGAGIYTLVLLLTWVLGFIDALVHAKDAWAVMPIGLVLSVIVTVLACAATWLGFSTLRAGVRP
ncbi:MAG TPA: DUF2231 domain-containing protein [Burkholderiales bacterium]|nr:DUF2231 domain-containing protein [Burkholderiales bacterium]